MMALELAGRLTKIIFTHQAPYRGVGRLQSVPEVALHGVRIDAELALRSCDGTRDQLKRGRKPGAQQGVHDVNLQLTQRGHAARSAVSPPFGLPSAARRNSAGPYPIRSASGR